MIYYITLSKKALGWLYRDVGVSGGAATLTGYSLGSNIGPMIW